MTTTCFSLMLISFLFLSSPPSSFSLPPPPFPPPFSPSSLLTPLHLPLPLLPPFLISPLSPSISQESMNVFRRKLL